MIEQHENPLINEAKNYNEHGEYQTKGPGRTE